MSTSEILSIVAIGLTVINGIVNFCIYRIERRDQKESKLKHEESRKRHGELKNEFNKEIIKIQEKISDSMVSISENIIVAAKMIKSGEENPQTLTLLSSPRENLFTSQKLNSPTGILDMLKNLAESKNKK